MLMHDNNVQMISNDKCFALPPSDEFVVLAFNTQTTNMPFGTERVKHFISFLKEGCNTANMYEKSRQQASVN